MPTNLHTKLFQENGTAKILREDIIPWSESPYSGTKILSKHFTLSSPVAAGSKISTHGCGYAPGTSSLLVFMDGLCLDLGVHYDEVESGDEITLLFDCQEGVTFEFVAHGGYEVLPSIKYTVAPESADELSYCPVDPSRLTTGSITINWGDGSDTETIEPSTDTTVPTHAYPTSDGTRYQIVLSADDETWAGVTALFFGTSTTVSLSTEDSEPSTLASKTTPVDQTSARVRYLVSVDSQLPTLGFTTRAYMFYNNRLLESVPNDIFANQASEITSFKYCFYYCLSLKCPTSELLAGCSSATDFTGCFEYCQNLDSEESFPAGFFSDCVAMETVEDCFCGAWIGNVDSPMFDALPNLATTTRCFGNAVVGDVNAPLFSNLPSITALSGASTSYHGLFYDATIGTVNAPLITGLDSVQRLGNSASYSGCFNATTFGGDINAPIVSDMASLVNPSYKEGSGTSDCFDKAAFEGGINSPVFADMPKMTAVYSSHGLFYSVTFSKGVINTNLFENCPVLSDVRSMFSSSSNGLTSVSENIFAGLPALEQTDNAFSSQTNLVATIDLTESENITSASTFANASATVTVKVKAGSVTEETFAAGDSNCTVEAV